MNPRRSNTAEVFPPDDEEVDPVWAAFEGAPMAKEPETEEQRRLVEAARRGPFVSGAVVSAEVTRRCQRGN
jgi:hypothetical protein